MKPNKQESEQRMKLDKKLRGLLVNKKLLDSRLKEKKL